MATIPIIGKTTVGGASKEIAGGRVNVGGAWKSVVKSYANVNGVWVPTWKELGYTWKKYRVNTTTTYTYTQKTAYISHILSDPYKIGTNFSFDESTGIFTLTNEKTVTGSDYASTYWQDNPYVIQTVSYTSGFVIGAIMSKHSGSVSTGSSNFYFSDGTKYESVANTTQTRGSYIEDVTDLNPEAYPTNGIHTDGYWYVKQ